MIFKIRYIIEDSILQAKLLNRTLILPSYIYARGCAFPMSVYSAYSYIGRLLSNTSAKLVLLILT